MSMPSPVSESTSRRSPFELRVELVGRQDVQHDQLGAGRRELADDPIGRRIEEVGHQDHDAPTVELRGGVAGRRDEVRRAGGRLDRRQVGEQSEHPPRPA